MQCVYQGWTSQSYQGHDLAGFSGMQQLTPCLVKEYVKVDLLAIQESGYPEYPVIRIAITTAFVVLATWMLCLTLVHPDCMM